MDFFWALLGIFSLVSGFYAIRLYIQKETQKRFHEYYRQYLEKDMMDFYREMESYGLLLQNRLESFKNLIKMQQKQLSQWEEVYDFIKKTKKGNEISDFIDKSQSQLARLSGKVEILEKEILQSRSNQSSVMPREKIKSPEAVSETFKEKKPLAETPARPPEKPPVRPIPSASVISPPPIRENYAEIEVNYAEEILRDESPPSAQKDPIDRQMDLARELRRERENKAGPTPESPFWKFAESLGKSIAPLFGIKNPPEVSLPATKTGMYNPPSTVDQGAFLRKMEQQSGRTLSPPVPPRPSVKPENPQPEKPPAEKNRDIIKIHPDELEKLIARLQTPGENRVAAIRTLMGYRFSLQDISDFSGISMSELEIIRNIYRL